MLIVGLLIFSCIISTCAVIWNLARLIKKDYSCGYWIILHAGALAMNITFLLDMLGAL